MPRVAAILVSAGNSTRMGLTVPKPFLPLNGKPVIVHTLCAFEEADTIDDIVLVVRGQDEQEMRRLTERYALSKLSAIVTGGETRQQSVAKGLEAIGEEADYVAIHDGARPLIRPEEIDGVVAEAFVRQAVTMAVPVKDTIKVANEARQVLSTPDRATLWSIQTPQVFAAGLYRQAMEEARAEGSEYTDDCQLVESMGTPVFLCKGTYRNLKITTLEDLQIAEALWERRSLKEGNQEEESMIIGCADGPTVPWMRDIRTGHGYDVHRFAEGRKLVLGGVEIPYEKGLLGHSDADVLAHAISDALLGAASLGDIGLHFPDDDPAYEGADSLVLLSRVCQLVREEGHEIVHVDATVLAQAPKLRPYILLMRQRLAAACGLSESQVNVKATTEEYLGFTGRGEGISAHAVCTTRR